MTLLGAAGHAAGHERLVRVFLLGIHGRLPRRPAAEPAASEGLQELENHDRPRDDALR